MQTKGMKLLTDLVVLVYLHLVVPTSACQGEVRVCQGEHITWSNINKCSKFSLKIKQKR